MNDVIAQAQPQLIAFMKSAEFDVIEISSKDDIAYVTYSLTMNINGQTIKKDAVQKLKLNNGNWMLLLPPDGEASIAGIKARFQ